jgi:hypothetical protein
LKIQLDRKAGDQFKNIDMWKFLLKSQKGTSHNETGMPCQDSLAVKVVEIDGSTFLIFACSDGAGSASHSNLGSRRACDEFICLAQDFLNCDSRDVKSLEESEAKVWITSICATLREMANEAGIPPKQFACTLLAGIVSEDLAVFFQIGDGAIVVNESLENLAVVFWPQSGEYVNTTHFLTDEDAETNVQFAVRENIRKLAVFTDGLERLLLRFEDHAPHSPALMPMFNQLIATDSSYIPELEESLGRFLNSPQVNARTDDDKSLILAVRS